MHQRGLEQVHVATFLIEASVSTMILFCVKSAKMLLIYINGGRFSPVALISVISHADSNIGDLCEGIIVLIKNYINLTR